MGDVKTREAVLFVLCAHSESFPKSIKAHWKGTGIANGATFLWNMSHESLALQTPVTQGRHLMADEQNGSMSSLSLVWEMVSTIYDLSWRSYKLFLEAHPVWRFRVNFDVNLHEAIMPYKQLGLLWCGGIINWNWWKRGSLFFIDALNPHQLSPNLRPQIILLWPFQI